MASKEPPSPHALIYRLWAKPVGKMLFITVGTFYTLHYLRELLDNPTFDHEKSANNKSKSFKEQ